MKAKAGMQSVSRDHYISEPARDNAALQQLLRGREHLLDLIPSIPAIVQSLLKELDQPPESVDLRQVAQLIGRDKLLTAQSFRMANSALFSRGQPADSILGAIRTLGIARVRDITVSCTIMRIGASQNTLDPVIFWEHSLGCAILGRKLARSVGFQDPDKAYLAGLLHDIGYVVNLVLAPEQMQVVLEQGLREHVFAGEVEHSTLGFTHCQSGELLASKWHFSADIVEVIRCHHNPASATLNPALVAIIALSDRMCRSANLGLGYAETPDPGISWGLDWEVLAQHCPGANEMSWEDFVKDSDSYFAEIRELVTALFSAQPA